MPIGKHFFNTLLLIVGLLSFIGCSKEEMPDQTPDIELNIEAIHKVEIICHQGHLHGKNFHANAQPEKSPYLRKQIYVLQKNDNDEWKQIITNQQNEVALSKSILVEGGGAFAFEFIYYNIKGERINSSFSDNSNRYQTLFAINSYTDNETKEVTQTPKKGKELVSYIYRDTDPENEMYRGKKDGEVKLTNSKLGLKGYFHISPKKVSFNLNVSLLKYNTTGVKKEKAFYLDVEDTNIDKSTTFSLPINIVTVTAAFDDEMEQYFLDLASYFGITPEEMETLEDVENTDSESSNYWM